MFVSSGGIFYKHGYINAGISPGMVLVMNAGAKRQFPVFPHGGDTGAYQLEGKPPPLDFSSNISPLGLPDGVRRALAEKVSEFVNYPDPYQRKLRTALAEKHGMELERIVCGAGSADLIFRAVRALRPESVLVTAPAFSEYERASAESGAEVSYYPLTYPDFTVNDDILREIPGKDLVFLCNPNNPTGLLTPPETIRSILDECRKHGTILILDECFMDLIDDPDKYSSEPLLADYKNLIILKAFTKTYAMAGLRLGYALCAAACTAMEIESTGPPWSVSVPAQIAGIQALKETDYLAELRTLIKNERRRLKKGLADAGAEILGGSANYVFFRVGEKTGVPDPGAEPAKRLAAKGILIRDCSNYKGLESGMYYRAAVRLPEENDLLIREISRILYNHYSN